MRRTLSAIFIVLSIVTAFAAFGVQQWTAWTYQGQLQRNGAAYNGTCNFQFSLWDAASAGAQQGQTQSINSVNVVNGLFTVVLDLGYEPATGTYPFTGAARWLGTSVQCSGDGGFTPLDPRQPITATPYALSLRPGANIIQAEPGFGSSALVAQNQSNGNGVYAYSLGGIGLFGGSENGTGVAGRTYGQGPAIYGESLGTGYAGQFVGPVDIRGGLTDIRGGLTVISGDHPTALFSITNYADGIGVYGHAEGPNSAGVYGRNRDSAAIWGLSTGAGSAIYGENTSTGYAGRFIGPVHIQGTLSKSAGSFQIDHPLDPANKFLSHSFVESPDMMNIYNGNVITDEAGSAIVTLPDYFEALNRDCRYQLTVLGQFAQAIVSRKVAQNSFEIRTDKPGVEVSWQVTGIRQDVYAKEHPIVVEEFKPAEQQGMYLYPAGFGAGEEKGIGYSSRPATAPPRTEQKVTKKTK